MTPVAETATRETAGLDPRPGVTDLPAPETDASVEGAMQRAVELGECVRGTTAPNPWVGAVLITTDGQTFEGATEPPPGRHAEIVALDAARDVGADSVGGTLVTTLEPCSHTGRTAPCIEAVISADIARVVVGVTDPDPNVAGTGIEALRDAGIEVQVAAVFGDEVGEGVSLAPAAAVSLRPYLHQRRYGRPWVVLKMAATLDGRIGAPDGTSQWITSPTARADVHALRARCDAVLVGAGTVRSDNPSLTVRDLPDDSPHRPLFDLRERLRDGHPNPATLPFSVAAAERLDPRRYVLGLASADASVQPCSEESGALRGVLRRLAADGVIEMLVEGGAQIAGELHRDGFVDEYVVYLAPALSGGDDGLPMLAGPGAPTIGEFWRGEIADTRTIGADVRITMHPRAQQTIDPSDIAGTAGHGARPPNEH